MTRPADGFQLLLGTLDRLEIPYMIGGSVASAIHGIGRTTVDVDVVVQLPVTVVSELIDELKTSFHCDAETAMDAVRRGRSFNVIHVATAYKFDLFPLRSDTYDQASFARRLFREGRVFSEEPVEFCVASPEDTILSKLRCYRQGWAAAVGVEDLLARFVPPKS